ncbi:MAG: CHASE2 domain-containing protein [Gammaproteobacteria bacterium]|nr:CHASE2 domain-containing protein [Gammaproteobacteria bacterium]
MTALFDRVLHSLRRSHVIMRLAISFVAMIPFIMHTSGWQKFNFLGELETFAYDARVRLTTPGGIDERIVIIDLDERSINVEGHWPWPRDKMANLVNTLYDEYEIKVLGFDALFSESYDPSAIHVVDDLLQDPEVPGNIRARLQEQRYELETDRIFGESMIARDLVMGFAFRYLVPEGDEAETGLLPEPLRTRDELTGITVEFPRAEGFVSNLPILQSNALTAGFINKPLIDDDGITRRAATLSTYKGDLYGSLSLAIALQVLGNPPLQFVFATSEGELSGLAIEALKMGENTVRVDNRAGVLVPYRGPRNSFPYVSATDVLNGNADAEVLRDAICLFGASAAGLLDLHSTPVGGAYPGVEVHANMVAGMIDGKVRYMPEWARGVELVVLIPIGLLIALWLPRLSPFLEFVALLVIAALLIAINLYYWTHKDFVIPVAPTLAYLFLVALLQLNYGFFVESKNKRRLSGLFGQYIPPEIVDEMDNEQREISIEGENREMSVLFSDVRGFTTISEGLKPTELTQFMNAFLTPITEIIHRNRGTIDKYMGDAVMAFWGAPLTDKEHARHAVEAGMEMIARMSQMREEFAERGWPEVRVGVGVNTGPMNVGNMGSKFRVAYTVLGDAVNLGSRLEGQTKNYGVEFIVSETTYVAIPDFAFRELDRLRVKGKNKPVAIFEPIGPKEEMTPESNIRLSRYHLALMLYHAQKWDLAETELIALQEEDGHPIYEIYRERIEYFRQNPPEANWDGVYTATSK